MTKKFTPRYLGPFKIIKMLNTVAVKLELPPTLKIHPVFHTNLVNPWRTDTEFSTHKVEVDHWALEVHVAGCNQYPEHATLLFEACTLYTILWLSSSRRHRES